MALKGKGPLLLLQREVEDLRKQVDALTLDVLKKDGSNEDLFRRCQELQKSAEKNLNALKKLTKDDEPTPVANYEQRKLLEERRLSNILEQINTLFLQLSPPGPSATTDTNSVGDKEDDDDDEEEEEEEENDNSEDYDGNDHESKVELLKSPSQSGSHIYTAIYDFKAQQEGDLSVKKGDVLRIIKMSADDWWLAQDSKGNRGVVPKNHLKFGSAVCSEDDENDDDYDEEDESEEDDEQYNEELSEDGEKESKASNWATVRKALTEIDATDVLSAMGAIPPGFRASTLNKLLVEGGVSYRGSHYIQPELSQSKLSFNDLFLEPDTGMVRAREVYMCVCFSLWSCRMIPTPGVGLQVLSRHIRLCASDGARVLSNIHTVRATYNPKSPKTWSFSPQTTGILPTLLNGHCFLRCNAASPELGILFELGVTFIRNSTGERGELSCGWAFLKLSDGSGNPLPNRTYELQVNGGTPYEKYVTVEASMAKGSPTGVFKQIFQASRQPKLIVKLKSANSQIRTQLSLLPDTLLHCVGCVHLLVLHRQLLADTLLVERPTMQTADLLSNPVLSTFPLLLDQPDLLDALRSAWLDAEIKMSRSQKKDFYFLKKEFIEVYMSSVYFLLHSPALPAHRWADLHSEEQRARVIYETLDSLKHNQHASSHSAGLEVYVDPAHQHLAFDVSELTFDFLSVAQ
ncbi:nephrocystin-1 [Takifugu flavidus]|uniref:nephrocystin-1 n=1 Tax=Takifugu flavidus TaxID=433684 RepID=UPI002544C41E|nr:nephrocystin-1 [Takifugu flavidus]